ncbi:hypothetical protein [Streptomyces luteireticuli]|uniref:hypothetical protein n=1 Tax=Streptomyces luteireticuli TaxID=173858 RepID=UPI003555BFA5
MSKQIRRYLPVVLSASIAPWLVCTLIFMGESVVLFGDADGTASTLLAGPLLLVPVLIAALVSVTVVVFRRLGRLRRDQWPLAGLVICLAAWVTHFAVSAALSVGGGGAGMVAWALFTGYPIVVFWFTTYAWRKTIH